MADKFIEDPITGIRMKLVESWEPIEVVVPVGPVVFIGVDFGKRTMTKQERKDRNLLICSIYTEGVTQEAIGERFRLSKARVGQILYKAGLIPADRLGGDTRRRSESVGVKLSKPVKSALATEAARKGLSTATFAAELIEEALTARKVPIILPKPEPPSLPFTDTNEGAD